MGGRETGRQAIERAVVGPGDIVISELAVTRRADRVDADELDPFLVAEPLNVIALALLRQRRIGGTSTKGTSPAPVTLA